MSDSSLFDKLKRIGKLPTPPGVVLRLLELTRQEDVLLKDIVDTIGMDPGLSAKILRFANSPMAGLPRSVTSLQQAVSLIGIRGVMMMALSFSLVSSKKSGECAGFDQRQFWAQSLACGVAARMLAERTKVHAPEEAFMAGLLSQIGRSVLAVGVPAAYSRVIVLAPRVPRDLPAVEFKALGGTYATVGAEILADWGIPSRLVEAIAAFRTIDPDSASVPLLAKLLDVAEVGAAYICLDTRGPMSDLDEFCTLAQRWCGVQREEALELIQTIARAVEDMRTLMEMPRGNTRSPSEIEAEVRDCVAELTLATSLENQDFQTENQELLRRATTDRLTGLKNRAAFDERMTIELERACRSGGKLALMMIDVDKFKLFNDAHGHLAGDCVLQRVATTLEETVRKVDFVARYGGEEFAIIVPDTSPNGAMYLCERLREAVEENQIEFEGKSLSVTISVGVAVFQSPDRALTATTAIKQADQQLYAAKQGGRNRVCVCIDGTAIRPAAAAAV